MLPPVDWWRPKRCTCSVWATVQLWRFGGTRKFIHNRHFPRWAFWMFRTLWQPPQTLEWWSYVPLKPKSPKEDGILACALHAIWFEGEPRRVRAR